MNQEVIEMNDTQAHLALTDLVDNYTRQRSKFIQRYGDPEQAIAMFEQRLQKAKSLIAKIQLDALLYTARHYAINP
ncbi:hypothetical protein IT409_01945 [Candidatus Falkowbacteria bacterium]|nr:hypothetical protein [Candidatus Falkowbacteria bacterium]